MSARRIFVDLVAIALRRKQAKVPAAPPDVAAGAVEHCYRACPAARGYARAKTIEPAPPGSYRGIENADEFGAVTPASAVAAKHQLDGRWHRVGAGSASLTLRIKGTAPGPANSPVNVSSRDRLLPGHAR